VVFINRHRELTALTRALQQESALFVLYGRRRLGKTALLKQFYNQRPHLYFVGDQGPTVHQVQALARRLGEERNDSFLRSASIQSWRDLFAYLRNLSLPLDLVLDEFPYLCHADPSLPSLLQNTWDESWCHSPVRLILCGSSTSFMENEVLSEKSPLFGRRTGQMQLGELSFWDSRQFFPDWSIDDQIRAYAWLGGTPAYLAKFLPNLSLADNVCQQILEPSSYLYTEPRYLMQQELREPGLYFAILAAVAAGMTRLNDIAQNVQRQVTQVNRYLDILCHLDIVEREVPVTESLHNSRKGLYRLKSNFFRAWFRYVHPNLAECEWGQGDWIWANKILPDLEHYVSRTYEDICRDWLLRQSHQGQLAFRPDQVGRWWDRQDEIDILAYDKHNLIAAECKWASRPVGPATLAKLRQKRAKLTQFQHHQTTYFLFSRSGFVDLQEAPDLRLITLS